MTGLFRKFRSMVPFGSASEESFSFARFHDEPDDTTELACFQSNGVAKEGGGRDSQVPPQPTLKGPSSGDGTTGQPESLPESGGGHGEGRGEEGSQLNRISEWQAGWNVTNAIQGMFIVTFPYTVFEGGYWAIVAMIVVAYVCCYTGKILVDCLYEDVDEPVSENPDGCAKSTENPTFGTKSPEGGFTSRMASHRKRVRNSYVEIAETVWGKMIGGRVVFVAQLIELLMTCILYVLLCGELMVGIFPGTSLTLTAWIVISAVPLLPCAFLRSLRHVAWLSFWCTVAHMFINGIILIYCFTRAAEWQWDAVQIKIDIWTFPISLGIVIFSYTSQIFLPSLEGNLVDRTKFAAMMHWTHLAAAIFKAAFSYIGFVTFGTETKEVITNNLPNQTMKVIVNVFLVAKALLSYPLPYFATADLLESKFFRGRPDTTFPPCFDVAGTLKIWALLLRLTLVVVTMLLAIVVPHFAILMGLIGSFTGNMLSLVWPAYFHLAIKGRRMGYTKMAFDICIILLGLTCSGLGIYYSFHALVRAFEGFEPKPFQTH